MKKYQVTYYALVGCNGNDNKIYIGQTIRDLQLRLTEHRADKTWCDTFIIDESYSTDEESLDIENGWMDYYRSLGWKIISKKQSRVIRENSQSTREKLRLKLKGRQNIWNFKPVRQYDLQGNFIQEYESAKAAAEHFKCNPNNINHCAKKNQTAIKLIKSCGFIWKYVQ
jgi:hypothetical protein